MSDHQPIDEHTPEPIPRVTFCPWCCAPLRIGRRHRHLRDLVLCAAAGLGPVLALWAMVGREARTCGVARWVEERGGGGRRAVGVQAADVGAETSGARSLGGAGVPTDFRLMRAPATDSTASRELRTRPPHRLNARSTPIGKTLSIRKIYTVLHPGHSPGFKPW